jgi:hypothetical protein
VVRHNSARGGLFMPGRGRGSFGSLSLGPRPPARGFTVALRGYQASPASRVRWKARTTFSPSKSFHRTSADLKNGRPCLA